MFSLLVPVRRNWRGKSSHKSVRAATAAGSLTSWTDPSCWYRPTPTSLALHLLFPSSSFGNSNDSDPHGETRYRGGSGTHTHKTDFLSVRSKKEKSCGEYSLWKRNALRTPQFFKRDEKESERGPALLRAKEKKKERRKRTNVVYVFLRLLLLLLLCSTSFSFFMDKSSSSPLVRRAPKDPKGDWNICVKNKRAERRKKKKPPSTAAQHSTHTRDLTPVSYSFLA